MKNSRFIYFIPSIVLLYSSFAFLDASVKLNNAIEQPLQSEQFIAGVGNAINQPWLQHSALRLYFKKLSYNHVNPLIWANSDLFARTLFEQYQYSGTIEIMLTVAHTENNPYKELYWANMYAQAMPNNQHAQALLYHAQIGHQNGLPLSLEGAW